MEAAKLERDYPMRRVESKQLQHVFVGRLKQYDSDKSGVAEQDRDQEKVMQRIQEANAEFVTARKGDTSNKQRETVLQSLQNGYFNYKEILSNLQGGRKFYNDLIQIVKEFRGECKSFVFKRRTEASQITRYVHSSVLRRSALFDLVQ
jgi:programmed cell death 6-interacting protein